MAKLTDRIDEIEPNPGYNLNGSDGLFVHLKSGWILGDAHCFAAENKSDMMRELRKATRCKCEGCA